MVSRVPPVPSIPELLIRSSSDHSFVSTPYSPPPLSSDSHGNIINSDDETAFRYTRNTREQRKSASTRSSSNPSIKARKSSARAAGSTSDLSHSSTRPSFHTSSSYDRKTLQFLRYEVNRDSKDMKDGGLFKDLMLREPSSTALKEFAESEKRRAAAKTRKQQGIEISSVSSRQLPASVAKVNSKWDGMPGSDAKRMADGSIKGSASSIRTATSKRKSTASSIATSTGQRDITTRFSETLNKFPACPQGVSDYLSVQSIGSPTKSSFRSSVATSMTTASLPLSVEEDYLRYPFEKIDLSQPDQCLNEDSIKLPTKPSYPLQPAQANFAEEKLSPRVIDDAQFTEILVNGSDVKVSAANALQLPATSTALIGSSPSKMNMEASTHSSRSTPHAGGNRADSIPPSLRGVFENVEESPKPSRKKVLLISWRKAFSKKRFCV